MNKLRVSILTTFYNLDSSYSLASVVINQLTALVKNDYKPIFFVLPSFHDDDKVPAGVEVRKVVPQAILEPYHQHIFEKDKNAPASFDDDVKKISAGLIENMKDVDVAITHDWMLVDDYLPYAAAIGLVGKEYPKIKWLNWIHSAPSKRPADLKEPWTAQFELMPNSKIVYLNNTDSIMVAERYGGILDDVRVVRNPTDVRTFFNLDPLVSKMIDTFDLLSADIVQVYPLSTPRMVDGKQVDKVIKIFAKLKSQGKSVRLIVPNAHANAQKEKDLIKEMQKLALDKGLDITKEVIFTSMIEPPKYEAGVSHNVVRDLFLLSNLFIFPTVSENAPLILLEAASCRNLLVLNDDFLPLREFFGENALYFKFSSARVTTTYNDEDVYYNDVAKIIISELARNKPLNAFRDLKQKYNYDEMFKQIENIIYENVQPKP